MNPEENDALWKLLGKADRKPEISPTFAQNVTRHVRQLPDDSKAGFWKSLFSSGSGDSWSWMRPTAALGALAAIVVTAFVILGGGPEGTDGLTQGEDKSPDPIAGAEESMVAVDPVLEGFGDELERIDQLDSLVAAGNVEDFADEEIAMLLF